MATFTRSQRLLASAGAAALGGTALLTTLGGNIFTLAAVVDMTAPFARAPASGWSYYGLAELYKARGNAAAAKKAEADLAKTWIGDRKLLRVSNL